MYDGTVTETANIPAYNGHTIGFDLDIPMTRGMKLANTGVRLAGRAANTASALFGRLCRAVGLNLKQGKPQTFAGFLHTASFPAGEAGRARSPRHLLRWHEIGAIARQTATPRYE